MRDALPHAEAARIALGDPLFRYVTGRPTDGSEDRTDPNVSALARYRLVPRVMRGASGVSLATTLAGRALAAPLAVGAFAGDRLFHPDGLLPIAQACADLGIPLFVSEETVTPLAAITAAHRACWLQIRAAGAPDRAAVLVEGAAAAGACGIVLTVLAPTHPVPGRQPGGFSVGREIAARGWTTIGSTEPGIAPLATFPAWTWTDLETVVRRARDAGLPVLAKGILHPEDATRAEEAGCAGSVVSNIGLRQTWRWAPAAERLPAVRAAARAPVLLDGGIRSGADVLVAVALGAAVAVTTRPVLSALAAGGGDAVRGLLGGWADEMRALAAWCGVETPEALHPGFLARIGEDDETGRDGGTP